MIILPKPGITLSLYMTLPDLEATTAVPSGAEISIPCDGVFSLLLNRLMIVPSTGIIKRPRFEAVLGGLFCESFGFIDGLGVCSISACEFEVDARGVDFAGEAMRGASRTGLFCEGMTTGVGAGRAAPACALAPPPGINTNRSSRKTAPGGILFSLRNTSGSYP